LKHRGFPLPLLTVSANFLLSPEPIPDTTPAFAAGEGAEVRFLGTVRGEEGGRPISGIDYTAYLPMAEKMLGELMAQGKQDHGPHEVFIQHRLGLVAAEIPSILIRVRTRHSAEAFELCRWYLKEIKTRVPIWKRPVFADS
jgi:molybdopterin synthase catalytic subunit